MERPSFLEKQLEASRAARAAWDKPTEPPSRTPVPTGPTSRAQTPPSLSRTKTAAALFQLKLPPISPPQAAASPPESTPPRSRPRGPSLDGDMLHSRFAALPGAFEYVYGDV